MRLRPFVFAVPLGIAAFAASPTVTAEDELLDPQLVRAVMPEMKQLSDKGGELVGRLHGIMEKLHATRDELEQRELRGQIRQILTDYRATKTGMIASVRRALKMPSSPLSNEEALARLRGTDLEGIVWNDAFFDKCIRDLSRAIDVPIRLQYSVIQKNQVAMTFQKAPAEMILATLCNGFDLRYVIHDGEIVIYKKITPLENRFLDYQKRHPDVKLRYWEHEDASGDVSKKKGGK